MYIELKYGAFLFSQNFSPEDFLSKHQCENHLDKLHCSFFKHVLCVNSRTSNWEVQSETNRPSIVSLILIRLVRYQNHVTESSSPIIQETLEPFKQLHKEAKTSWFTSRVQISELVHNSKEPCFNLQMRLKKRLSKIVIDAWYTERNHYG